MPTATLTFRLPEEEYEHRVALNGGVYLSILQQLDSDLLSKIKYEEHPEETLSIYEDLKGTIHSLCEEEGIGLWDY